MLAKQGTHQIGAPIWPCPSVRERAVSAGGEDIFADYSVPFGIARESGKTTEGDRAGYSHVC